MNKLLNAVFGYKLKFWALFVGLLFPIAMSLVLLHESRLAIEKFGFLNFLTNTKWDPVAEEFGGATMIVGTLISTLIAIFLATPVAIGIAIFLTELAPRKLAGILSTLTELLAAIPSIIYGMWGFFVLAPLMSQKVEPFLQRIFGNIPIIGQLFSGYPTGLDVLTTSLVLSIMIMPFTTSVVREAFMLVPDVMKESAYGLGATKWETIRHVVIPYTTSGIVGGVILSTGRALGETMAVTFLAGNVPQIPKSLFDSFTTVTVTLANQFTEADTDLYLSSLYYLALVLFAISFSTLILSKVLYMRIGKR